MCKASNLLLCLLLTSSVLADQGKKTHGTQGGMTHGTYGTSDSIVGPATATDFLSQLKYNFPGDENVIRKILELDSVRFDINRAKIHNRKMVPPKGALSTKIWEGGVAGVHAGAAGGAILLLGLAAAPVVVPIAAGTYGVTRLYEINQIRMSTRNLSTLLDTEERLLRDMNTMKHVMPKEVRNRLLRFVRILLEEKGMSEDDLAKSSYLYGFLKWCQRE